MSVCFEFSIGTKDDVLKIFRFDMDFGRYFDCIVAENRSVAVWWLVKKQPKKNRQKSKCASKRFNSLNSIDITKKLFFCSIFVVLFVFFPSFFVQITVGTLDSDETHVFGPITDRKNAIGFSSKSSFPWIKGFNF